MQLSSIAVVGYLACLFGGSMAQNTMVKMCLFYKNPSGHARSDPIIDQQCASGHVHTFYGPQNFHPNTSYEEIRDTPARFSSSPYVENQSLYWHPSIYEVVQNGNGTKTYTRVNALDTSPYYRWDNSVLPRTEAFPPNFRMIAHSNDEGANGGSELGENMFTECCSNEDNCENWNTLHFPANRQCDFLGIAFAMPTCWNGISLGDDNDHKSHMAYTTNGLVEGPCPTGFNHRVPQIQLFVRIHNYDSRGGKTYELSDGKVDVFHVDFMNGWQEGKLQEIIDNCPLESEGDYGYNPPCGCTPESEEPGNFLTTNPQEAQPVCDADVRELIIDEAIDVTNELPSVSCEGPTLKPKSWTQITDSLFGCEVATEDGGEGGEEEQPEEDEGENEEEEDENEDDNEGGEEEQPEEDEGENEDGNEEDEETSEEEDEHRDSNEDEEWEEEGEGDEAAQICEEACEMKFEQCFESLENRCENDRCIERGEARCEKKANKCFVRCEGGPSHRSLRSGRQ